jgi:phosphoenolpyruvate synthase/pyruvate phosphate dikinase
MKENDGGYRQFGWVNRADCEEKDPSEEQLGVADSPIWEGVPASPGTGTGTIVEVPTKKEEWDRDFPRGAVLYSQSTKPWMVSMMDDASAVITVLGGMGSHAAQVSRELNTPCVANVMSAQGQEDGDIIREGQTVLVNGNEGTIRII